MSFQEYASGLQDKAKFGVLKPQYLAGLAALVLVIILAIGYQLFFSKNSEADSFSVESSTSSQTSEEATASNLYVHVSGCVNSPGLVEVSSGERIAKAIELAGGATQEADLNSINLAKKVEDGEQIVVPSRNAENTTSTGTGEASTSSSQSSSSSSGKININTADSTELQKISGIGESKAAKIIAYRQTNGKFKSIEDLTNVSGIGDKTLASIRDQICV